MSPLLNSDSVSSDQDFLFAYKDSEAREFIENLWVHYRQYADKDFVKKVPLEFHSRFWEMYLTCALKKLGKEILPKKRRAGPDIEIENLDSRVWVEAVAATPGNSTNNPMPSEPIPSGKISFFRVPEEKIVLRYTTAIDEKVKKYRGYAGKNVIAINDPYVIAVNGHQVPLSRNDEDEIPYIVQAVLPFGLPFVNLDEENSNGLLYKYRPELRTPKDGSVQKNIFLLKEYEFISGILFSMVGIYNYRMPMGKDFIFIRNPMAKNRLPPGWLGIGHEYRVDGNLLMRETL